MIPTVHRLRIGREIWIALVFVLAISMPNVTVVKRWGPLTVWMAVGLVLLCAFGLWMERKERSEIVTDDEGVVVNGERIEWARLVGFREIAQDSLTVRMEFLRDDFEVFTTVSQLTSRTLSGRERLIARVTASAPGLVHVGPFGSSGPLTDAGYLRDVPWSHAVPVKTDWAMKVLGWVASMGGIWISMHLFESIHEYPDHVQKWVLWSLPVAYFVSKTLFVRARKARSASHRAQHA